MGRIERGSGEMAADPLGAHQAGRHIAGRRDRPKTSPITRIGGRAGFDGHAAIIAPGTPRLIPHCGIVAKQLDHGRAFRQVLRRGSRASVGRGRTR
jgi:hypothetical protein